MDIVALVGTLGAGKSTLAMSLARFLAQQGYAPDEVAIVVNEAGGVTEIQTGHARVFTLPNGCFTCQDEAVLRSSLDDLQAQGVQFVLMEGFGVVSGEETKDFLRKVRYRHVIVSVLDIAGFARNVTLYGELLHTHLGVAHAVVATKHTRGPLPDPITTFLEEHQVRVPLWAGAEGRFPPQVWATLGAALQRQHAHMREDCSGCGHHHHQRDHHGHAHGDAHHHEHDHSHGWQTVVLELVPGTTVAALKEAAHDVVVHGAMRLKGRLGGTSFNVAPGAMDWNIAPTTGPGDLVICYMAEGAQWPRALLQLVSAPPELARSHMLLRVDTDVEATTAAVQNGMEEVSALRPIARRLDGGWVTLVTHPERLQLVKEVARRPTLKAAWFGPVMEACLGYWVRCGLWLQKHEAEVDPDHLPVHLRELAVSLAWWTDAFQEQLPPKLVQDVYALQPALMMARGLAGVEVLRDDPFWRYWQGVEYERALRFGFANLSEQQRSIVVAQADRVVAMARTQSEYNAFMHEFAQESIAA